MIFFIVLRKQKDVWKSRLSFRLIGMTAQDMRASYALTKIVA